MKKINIDNILYNLINTRAYILSEPNKNGLVLLANNTISFLITKEEFTRLNPQELGSEMPVSFKKLHFKDEQIQSTFIRYPIVNKVSTNYTNFLENLFKIYTTSSSISSESLHLTYNLSKTKEDYTIRVLGIKGSFSFLEVFNNILEFAPFLWEQLNRKGKTSKRKKENVSDYQLTSLVNELDALANPLIKAKIIEKYLQSYLLSLDNKLKVLVKSLYVNFEVDVENETFKSLRSNRKITRKSPKFYMPIEFNTMSLENQLKEINHYNEIYKEVNLLSQYENLLKGGLKKEKKKTSLMAKDQKNILKRKIEGGQPNKELINSKKELEKRYEKHVNSNIKQPKKLVKKKK